MTLLLRAIKLSVFSRSKLNQQLIVDPVWINDNGYFDEDVKRIGEITVLTGLSPVSRATAPVRTKPWSAQ